MLGMQLPCNTTPFPIGLIQIISYGMLMQHDCIIASCTCPTYLLNHTKLDKAKTFQPDGNVIMLPNAVQCARTLVLLWPRVSGQGDDRCDDSAATSALAGWWVLACSHRIQPCREEEARGEGCARLCGLAGSERRKEKGFWIRSSRMTCGKPQVTAKFRGNKQRSPGGKMWRR